MRTPPPLHALLRPGADWSGVHLAELEADGSGAIALARPPGATAGYVASGHLDAGPLDAGVGGEWGRVRVDAERPDGTAVALRIFTGDDPGRARGEADWSSAATLTGGIDALVGVPPHRSGRYLWLRVTLESDRSRLATPRLLQVHATTARETYLEHLPGIYRVGGSDGFLGRWLELFRSELSDAERLLEAMPRRFDPAITPEDHLRWLAGWLAFDLPASYATAELRALMPRAMEIHRRRGTAGGLRELIRIHAGVNATVVEDYRSRRLWRLGDARLGFGTGLSPALPDGMVVPGPSPADPARRGLTRAEYEDLDFAGLRFIGGVAVVSVVSGINQSELTQIANPTLPDRFVARWSGQILPRYHEVYTFHAITEGGVRLWVGEQLVIDHWTEHGPAEERGRIALGTDRWYPIRMDYYRSRDPSGRRSVMARLLWSSRSQPKEIVPGTRLYAMADDNVDPGVVAGECAPPGELVVGEAVVGESGPLDRGDFGEPLFSDAAHRFTVSVRAAELRTGAQCRALDRVLESERPAHTTYDLCLVDARMRVGFQARVGVDAIVGEPKPMVLDAARLGTGSALGGAATECEAPDQQLAAAGSGGGSHPGG